MKANLPGMLWGRSIVTGLIIVCCILPVGEAIDQFIGVATFNRLTHGNINLQFMALSEQGVGEF
jgi:hypothetical protein